MRGPAPRLESPDTLPNVGEVFFSSMRGVVEERSQERQRMALRPISFRAWSLRAPESRGPLSFVDLVWQEEWFGEEIINHPDVVVQKGTQIGASTNTTRQGGYQAAEMQRIGIYTFPTKDEVLDFSAQRFGPMIDSVPDLKARLGVNKVDQKQFGAGGWIYFRGLQKPLDSIDADFLMIDEFDDSDPDNVAKSYSRIEGPNSAGILRRFGVPLLAGAGIGELYRDSDQRVWHVKCDACSTWTPILGYETFTRNFDQERLELICSRASCRRDLNIRHGEWVAAYPGRSDRRIGYRVNKLMMPRKQILARLVESSKKLKAYEIENFRQRGLGDEYAAADSRLDEEQIRACGDPQCQLLESLATHNIVILAVDVASSRALNYTIEEIFDLGRGYGRKVAIGTIDGEPHDRFRQLCELMTRYSVTLATIDAGPDGMFSQQFANTFPGRVWQVHFTEPGGNNRIKPWDLDQATYLVKVWRSRVYDVAFARYRAKYVKLPVFETLPAEFVRHLGNLLRQREEDPDTGIVRTYWKVTGDHDFGQCEGYNAVGIELVRLGHGLRMAGGGSSFSMASALARDPYPLPAAEDEHEVQVYRPGFGG